MNFQFYKSKKLAVLLLLPFFLTTTPLKSESHTTFSALSFIASAGCMLGAYSLKSNYHNFMNSFEEQLINDWICSNNLNIYGEAPETVYIDGSPLTAQQSRIEYIKNTQATKSWLKGYKRIMRTTLESIPTVVASLLISSVFLFSFGLTTALSVSATH